MELIAGGCDGSRGCNQQKNRQELPDLVFVVAAWFSRDGYDVYAVDTTGGDDCKMAIKLLFNYKPSDPLVYTSDDMRMVVCGTNICFIGDGLDQNTNKYSREFVMVDLSNWRNRDIDDFKSLKGPEPRGAKPCPVAFSVDDRLYALAGDFYSTKRAKEDITNPAFEFFDPYDVSGDPCWKPLATPPFNDFYYSKEGSLAHKVVGKTLYVTLASKKHGDSYYSYSVTSDMWEKINIDESDTIRTNLNVCGNYNNWYGREDFDGNMMGFHFDRTKVRARDMKSKVDSKRMRKDHMAFRTVNDYFIKPKNYPYLLVSGLDHIDDLGGEEDSTFGFVAHLAGNIFCVVYLFPESLDDEGNEDFKYHYHACKFELEEHSNTLKAKILGCADYFPKPIGGLIGGFDNMWDKMQNK